MRTLEVNVAVIGAGTAGLNARREALRAGATDVVVIQDGPYGTTCARVGCMPSKLLIAAAERAHDVQTADLFGVHLRDLAIDGREVMARVQRERDRFAGFVVDAVERHPSEQHLDGRARFIDTTVLDVHDSAGELSARVHADAVVIATGSRTFVPPPLRALRNRLLTNEGIFELETLPESLLVVGAGAIGMELGQAFHRLGVRTRIVTIDRRIGPLTDPVVLEKARDVFGNELALDLDGRVVAAEEVPGGVCVRWRDGNEDEHEGVFSYVLAAAGVRPNLSGLNLEAAGLELGETGIPVHDRRTMQCGDSPVFIAGDATADHALLHEAADEGHIAGKNAGRYPDVVSHRRRESLSIVFTDPQISVVGASWERLQRESAPRHDVGEVSFDNQGRSRTMGVNRGHARVYGRWECGTLLGAELLAPRAEHLGHLLAWAVQSRFELRQILGMPFYHPVFEEGLRTALRDLAQKLCVSCADDPLYYGPGC